MSSTKKLKQILTLLVLGLFSLNFSQQILGPVQLEIPPFEKAKDSSNLIMNYNLELTPFTDKSISLKTFKKENTLIFYFSAVCGHCKAAYPHLKTLYSTLKKQNIKMVAIAATMNKDADIAQFIAEQKVDVPVLQDDKRNFSNLYGTGNVPLILLVNKKGEIIKFQQFNPSHSIDEINFAFADKSKF